MGCKLAQREIKETNYSKDLEKQKTDIAVHWEPKVSHLMQFKSESIGVIRSIPASHAVLIKLWVVIIDWLDLNRFRWL